LFNVVDPTEVNSEEALPTTVTEDTLVNIGAADGKTTYVLGETDSDFAIAGTVALPYFPFPSTN
jgi:hypothetical protein